MFSIRLSSRLRLNANDKVLNIRHSDDFLAACVKGGMRADANVGNGGNAAGHFGSY